MVNLEKPHASGLNGAIAAQLRAERVALGLTNDELAETTGIPKVSLQRYLAGTRAIDISTLAALADAMGVTATQIVRDAEQRLQRLQGQGEPAPTFSSAKPARVPRSTRPDPAEADAAGGVIKKLHDAKRDVRPARSRDDQNANNQADDRSDRDSGA